MADTVGDIAVRVGADISLLQGGMNRASKSVGQFTKDSIPKLRKVTDNIVKMGAAATVAGTAIVSALYTKQSQVIDQLAKTADALGVTTESLQAMNRIAELNGVTTEAMAKGLQRMEVRLGEAARRGGSAAEALKDVGVNLEDIIKLEPDKQLEELSAALIGVENQAMKASIVTDLFGREGVKMLKVLNQISDEGLQPTIDNLEKYGIAINRIDAAKVEAANDAWLKSEEILGGVANKLTIELAPYVQEVAEQFALASEGGLEFADNIKGAIETTVRSVAFMGDVIQGLRVTFSGLEIAALGVVGAFTHAVQLGAEAFVLFGDSAIKVVNSIITAVNKIPGIDDIEGITLMTDSDFMNSIRDANEEIRVKIGDMRTNMHDLAMQDLPSTIADNFLLSVKENADDASASLVKVKKDFIDIASDPFGGNDPSMEFESFFQANKQDWGIAAKDTAGAMQNIVQTMSTGSKRAFEIAKAWAMADAIISTAQGIAAGVKLGWPMGIPAVAWAAATGYAQITAIKNQKFGGAGGAAAAGGGTPATAPNPVGVGGGGGAQQSQTLSVAPIDPNAIFSGAQMQSFGESIHDFSKDGGKVVFEA